MVGIESLVLRPVPAGRLSAGRDDLYGVDWVPVALPAAEPGAGGTSTARPVSWPTRPPTRRRRSPVVATRHTGW